MSNDKKDKDMVVTLTGYDQGEVLEFMERIIKREVKDQVHEAVAGAVHLYIKTTVARIADDDIKARLTNEVDIVLEEGWRETDTYGSACGPPMSLKDRISKMLGAKAQGGYNKTAGQAILDDAYKKILEPEVRMHAKELKDKMESQAEKVMKDYLSKALSNATNKVAREAGESALRTLIDGE